MKMFNDNQSRSWTIDVNVAAIKRVRSLVGVDLFNLLDGSLVDRLILDVVLLCDVIYAVIKPQADARGVTDEDFGQAMAGDAIEHGTQALLDELVSFCPSSRDRANLGRVLAATRTAMEKARDVVEERLDGGELERVTDQVINQMTQPNKSGPSSTSAQDSSGLTQTP